MSGITFQKATKRQLPARIALAGPTGSGKTYSAMVEMAPAFGDRAVLIDTEHGKGALYGDLREYDHYRFDPPYDPSRLIEVLKAADAEGYDLVVVDSLSHFWEGEGGTIDIADAAGQRASGNSFAGWKVATPALRHLIDTMLELRAHLIVTMRSKMEYVLETNERGKQVPRKVGMAPVMRQGVEYEFDLVADIDLDHRITVSKSRCPLLADQMVQPNRAKEMAETFIGWLNSGAEQVTPEQVQKIRDAIKSIPDPEERKAAQGLFFNAYGKPVDLLATQFEEALKFALSLGRRPGAEDESAQPLTEAN